MLDPIDFAGEATGKVSGDDSRFPLVAMAFHTLAEAVCADRDRGQHPCQGDFRRSRWARHTLAEAISADRDGRATPLPRRFPPIAMGAPHPCQGDFRRSRWARHTLAKAISADRDGRATPLPRRFPPIAMGAPHPCRGDFRRSRWARHTLAEGTRAGHGSPPPLEGGRHPIAIGRNPCQGVPRFARNRTDNGMGGCAHYG
jgi:hypothetical protein